VLRVPNVALAWAAGLISAVGSGAMFVALPFYAYSVTGSVLVTATVALAEYLPTVGVAQIAGVVVDRWDPKRALVAANLALAVCTLAYLIADAWWWLAVVSLTRSSVAQLLPPASNTMVAAIAPAGRLAAVNSVNVIGSNTARLLGPALGGALLAVGGLSAVVVVDSVSFGVAAVLLVMLRLDRTVQPVALESWSLRWRQGWAAVRDHRVLRPLVGVMICVGFGEGFVSALIAPWMLDVAGGSSAQLGLMLSVQALGGIAGGLLMLRLDGVRTAASMLTIAALVSGVFLVVIFNYPLIVGPTPWPAIALTAAGGVPFAVYGTAQAVMVQHHSTDGLRGRIVGLTFGVQGIAQLIGIGAAGPAAHVMGPLAINAEPLGYLAAGLLAAATIHRKAPPSPE